MEPTACTRARTILKDSFHILASGALLVGVAVGEGRAVQASSDPPAPREASLRAERSDSRTGGGRGPGPDGRAEYRLDETAAEMTVDGVLDEPAWEAATPIPLPYETAPGDNEPAPVATRCRLAFDRDALYVGCVATDPEPGRIRAYITDRDDTRGHDRIIVAVDPFNDARRAFEFGMTALGVQSDAVYDEQNGGSDASWDAIWRSAGRIVEHGYVVEAAIPFRSLRFPETEGVQTWGFHARREWPRSELVETRSMHWDRDRGCVLCQANLVTGIQGVSPGLNLQLNPTVVTRKVDVRDDLPDGRMDGGPVEPEVGMDLRWSPTTDLAVNLTANPDFSQVEADAPQVDVNNRFALFFPEKRPFFLEGAEFFRTPLQAVFTRTVADPVAGAKLTGKVGASALGGMVAVDRETGLLFPGNQGSAATTLGRETTSAFLRFRRDVGGSGTLGALYTGRSAGDYGNHVAGADLFLRPLPAVSIRAQLLGSHTRYPEAVAAAFHQPGGDFTGLAGTVRLNYSTRDWWVDLNARALEPTFRADAGFIPQVDVRGVNGAVGRNFWGGDGAFLTRVGLNGGFWHNESWSGRLTGEGVWANLEFAGPWQSRLWLNPNLRRQWYDGTIYEFPQLWTGFGLQPDGSLRLRVWGMVGGGIDFREGRQAEEIRVNPSLEVRAGRHVDVRATVGWTRQSLDGEQLFRAVVSELRGVYNFDPRTFFRAIVQLRDTDRNPEMHAREVRPSRTTVATQLLLSYKVNPLTVLFLGYGGERLAATEPDRTRIPLTQRERSFFLKLGYAWRP